MMNSEKLNALIYFYTKNEDRIHFSKLEGYKWGILSSIRNEIIKYVKRHYKNGEWDQDYSDFYEFTRKTIGKTGNLVYSSSRSVMQRAADKYPERVRQMFIDLSGFNSEVPLKDRVCSFISAIDILAKENQDISKSGKSFHHDCRAVSVYLFMMDPEHYYNYMYTVFRNFSEFIGLKVSRTIGVNYMLQYFDICDEIKGVLEKDHKDWFEKYLLHRREEDPTNESRGDRAGHLLIQDIVYSLYYFKDPQLLSAHDEDIVYPTAFKLNPKKHTGNSKRGIIIDYEAQQRRNLAIGKAAERFVMENERRLVKKYGFDPGRVRHISKEEGDGFGYDILSCDEEGKDIYIEVKGTKGGQGSTFYITENELKCSIEYPEKYRLYRVYDFSPEGNSGRGKIAEIRGSLEKYCEQVVLYKVEF